MRLGKDVRVCVCVKGTYDVTHEEENAEIVGLAQTLYALVYVLWVETVIS